jgi:hypothetical protein
VRKVDGWVCGVDHAIHRGIDMVFMELAGATEMCVQDSRTFQWSRKHEKCYLRLG